MTVLAARHPILDTLSADLLDSGKWQRWCESDSRLAAQDSLAGALEAWRRDRCEIAYLTVAALASIGSSRGGNDDDAAMAVVVLLQDGIVRLAADLRDQCELDDVVAAVWEEVKRSAPNLGHRAPRFLLQRAKARLLAPASGFASRSENLRLEHLDGLMTASASHNAGHLVGHNNERSLQAQVMPAEDACEDLADLLDWARGTGVLEQADVDLVTELIAVSYDAAGREDAYRLIGERHGVAMRTIRRRRDAVVSRLRGAAHEYLAEVS